MSRVIILGVEDDAVVARSNGKLISVDSITEGDRTYLSSSIDFPEEYTDDPDTIAICHKLREC